MPIVVACKCGQQFRAKDEFAGRQMKCPKCGSIIVVPGGAPAPQQPAAVPAGGTDLDALMQMDQSAGMGGAGIGAPGGFPQQQGMPQGGGFQQPGFQSFGGGYGGQPRGKKKSGSPARLIVGISAGVVIVIAVVIIAIKVSSNADQIAENERINQKNKELENNPFAQPFEGKGKVADANAVPTTSGTLLQPNPNEGGAPGTNGSDNESESASATDEPFPFGETDLIGATNKWMDKGDHLSGLEFTEEEQLEIYAYSWMTHLLPYVGGQELYDDFDFEKEFIEGGNRSLTTAEVFQYLNPNQDTTRFEGLYFTGMGLSHFVGMSGAEDTRRDLAARFERGDPRAGMFGYDEIAKLSDITDGTSSTLMLVGSEKTAGPWISGGGSTVRGARKGDYAYVGGFYGFWSEGLKRPGALAAMADGSAREIPEEIDPAIFRAISTIAGGEEDLNLDDLGEAEDSELPPGIRERVRKEGEKQQQEAANKNNNQGAGSSSTPIGGGGRTASGDGGGR